MRRSLQKLHLGLVAARQNPIPQPFQCRRYLSAVYTLPHLTLLEATKEIRNDNSAKAHKIRELAQGLGMGSPDPLRIWRSYTDLVDLMNVETLPLEVHQAVLRRCTFSTAEIRKSTARKLQERTMSFRKPYHVHEARFKSIISNMRATGGSPTLDDFHFILKHFAAVGHYLGSQSVLAELLELGLQPTHKTYGLCLQAIAHRLSLPFSDFDRPSYVALLSSICNQLLADMSNHGIPITSVNLDLAIRILREGRDKEGLSKLLKLGYGIDLEYLDQPPLEDGKTEVLIDASAEAPSQAVQPFSTHTLNTVVDALGRMGHISKMVSLFETLTNPLTSSAPSTSQEDRSSSFDDDDDDFPIHQTPSTWTPRYAEPNSTTYNMLIKYAAAKGNVTIARHYVEQLMHAEHMARVRIRNELRAGKTIWEINAPRVSVSYRSLLPVYGFAHRNSNLELLRWVRLACKKAKRRKFRERKHLQAAMEQLQDSAPSGAVVDPNSSRGAPTPVLDLDLDTPETLNHTPLPPRKLDIHLHLSLLNRDYNELEALRKRDSNVLHRAIQRVKQRLGRRVWSKKDVYFAHEGRREKISRELWAETVGFQPDKRTQLRR